MREIKYIVLHCTATPQKTTVESIKNAWKQKGWKNVGYHYLIESNGQIHNLATIDKVTNGVAGYNAESIHISYIGGVDSAGKAIDNRTFEQKKQMEMLVKELHSKFPKALIQGHRDFKNVKKDCPSFDVKKWLQTISIKQDEKH